MPRLYGPGHFTEDPYSQVVSPHGIPVDDLVAVLQKEIRRSHIDNAVLAAYEMLTTSADVAQHLWWEGVSFPALAEQTGLARPSVYSYFGSRDDIVVAVSEASLPAWLTRIDGAMARARSPRSKLVAFVRAQRAVHQAGGYRLAGHEQRRRARRAVVGDVDDRDAGQSDAVQRGLGRLLNLRIHIRRRPAARQGSRSRRPPALPWPPSRPSGSNLRSSPAWRTAPCPRQRPRPCPSRSL
jgi:AcrR family transcriptional regulator